MIATDQRQRSIDRHLYRISLDWLHATIEFDKWLAAGGQERLDRLRAAFASCGPVRGRFVPVNDGNGTLRYVNDRKPALEPTESAQLPGKPVVEWYRSHRSGFLACRIIREERP